MARMALAMILLAALAAGCAPRTPAPWEDRPPPRTPERTAPPTREMPRPDAHRVERGDTLYSISFRYGLDWRDVAAWNRIGQPYTIQPGQVIRLRPPAGRAEIARVPPQDSPEQTVSERDQSAEPPRAEPAPPVAVQEPEPEPVSEPDPTRAPAPVADGAPERQVGGVGWRWPASGQVVRTFDASETRRGIHIGGSAGQPVSAAAGGQVVYSGTGLIGYGELIIIKHSETLLSAYAHNRRRLVSEGDRVGAGQPIAEMGTNERGDDLLHFEIRRNGQPVNPLDYLPKR